jgi:hypothetical protein
METILEERMNGNGHDNGEGGPDAGLAHDRLDEDRRPRAVAMAGETALAPDDPLAAQRDAILERQYEGFDHMGG